MSKEIIKAPSQEALDKLRSSFPVEKSFTRIMLPRLSFVSQDKMEGKGKEMKVVTEAGTFIKEIQTEELNEYGKKIWEKTEIGSTVTGTIIHVRKQLKMYNESTEEYTSSTVFDKEEDVVKLFCDKKEVGEGIPSELKAKYQYKTDEGKIRSKLEDNRILYVLIKDEVFQLNLRGSSMYNYFGYTKETLTPSALTVLSSESKEKGTISWNAMTFRTKRNLDSVEVEKVLGLINKIEVAVAAEKAYYNQNNVAAIKAPVKGEVVNPDDIPF